MVWLALVFVIYAIGGKSAIIIALLGVVAVPFVTFIIAARRLSGTVRTSEAADLWAESTNLRKEYKEEIRALRNELGACEERVGRVEERNRSLSRENADLRATIEEHEETIGKLRAEVARLTADNETLRAQLRGEAS